MMTKRITRPQPLHVLLKMKPAPSWIQEGAGFILRRTCRGCGRVILLVIIIIASDGEDHQYQNSPCMCKPATRRGGSIVHLKTSLFARSIDVNCAPSTKGCIFTLLMHQRRARKLLTRHKRAAHSAGLPTFPKKRIAPVLAPVRSSSLGRSVTPRSEPPAYDGSRASALDVGA